MAGFINNIKGTPCTPEQVTQKFYDYGIFLICPDPKYNITLMNIFNEFPYISTAIEIKPNYEIEKNKTKNIEILISTIFKRKHIRETSHIHTPYMYVHACGYSNIEYMPCY